MNLILFQNKSDYRTLPAGDPRTVHLREVLRIQKDDRFDVGMVNGPRGKATVLSGEKRGELRLKFEWGKEPPKPGPMTLLVGLPRPQTARKLLKEGTSLGLARMVFFDTEKGEPSYRKSKLWNTNEWSRHLIEGAEQAFSTHLPEVSHSPSLLQALNGFEEGQDRIALDNYEAEKALSHYQVKEKFCLLAVGPERGWSPGERNSLRKADFTLVHLGERVLRTETACIAAVSIIGAKLGLM